MGLVDGQLEMVRELELRVRLELNLFHQMEIACNLICFIGGRLFLEP